MNKDRIARLIRVGLLIANTEQYFDRTVNHTLLSEIVTDLIEDGELSLDDESIRKIIIARYDSQIPTHDSSKAWGAYRLIGSYETIYLH